MYVWASQNKDEDEEAKEEKEMRWWWWWWWGCITKESEVKIKGQNYS